MAVKKKTVKEQIVEIVSDSGEGAQKSGQIFGTVCAKMGNGVWTVEIIPAEIKPPARSSAGASGIRIRFGSDQVTNMGDKADLVMAFNEQVLYGRIMNHAFRPGTVVLLENSWAKHSDPVIREQYATALKEFEEQELVVYELALEEACMAYTQNPKVGKNMFITGMLCWIYDRDLDKAKKEIEFVFGKKGAHVLENNFKLLHGGYDYAASTLDFQFSVPSMASEVERVVMNGNQAVGLGVMASGMEIVSMYPITPATSASHYLASMFTKVGGFVHQAEDEIAAIGFAIGTSYAGKTACTITSGPGLALKTEFIGLAVMAEIPLVIVNVQRGGPSTGLPTKVEQGDLLAALYGSPGDSPKVVLAAATIEECYQFVILARKLAEAFRTPVMLLTDANLATGVQPFPRPAVNPEDFAPAIDQSPWDKSVPPYDWDPETGLSPRPIPGQPGGEFVLTGLAHTNHSKVAYDFHSNQKGMDMRSRKFATLQKTFKPPEVHGADEGDLLVVGWGSTLGAIEEAVDRVREEGMSISSLHIRFLMPLEPGLTEIFKKFKKVLTIELNYSDKWDQPGITPETRRYAQLAAYLRAQTLMDIDCWSNVHGQPLSPIAIYQELTRQIAVLQGDQVVCSV